MFPFDLSPIPLYVSDPPKFDDVNSRGSILIVLIAACEAVSLNEISDGMSERASYANLPFFQVVKVQQAMPHP